MRALAHIGTIFLLCGSSVALVNCQRAAKADAVATTTAKPATEEPPPIAFENAGLPYTWIDGHTGASVSEETAWAALRAAPMVCLGEEHSNVHHHWWQREVVKKLFSSQSVAQWALGLEMVQTPMQGVLSDFQSGTIDAKTFETRSGWNERWGFAFAWYEPTMRAAIDAKGSLLALNAPKEITKKISREGFAALTADENAQLPERVAVPEHQAWFAALMADMGAAHGAPIAKTSDEQKKAEERAQRFYAVQEIWDESMAQHAVVWQKAGTERHLAIIAGGGHCQKWGIPARAMRRGVSVVGVMPVIDSEGQVAAEIASGLYDFIAVMTAPTALPTKQP